MLSAFPPAAAPRRPVQILPGSKTAVVDLSLPKSATSPASLAGMASQLVWTLTSSSYGSASIQAVKLEVNGRVWTPPGASSAVLTRSDYPQPALEPPAGEDAVLPEQQRRRARAQRPAGPAARCRARREPARSR